MKNQQGYNQDFYAWAIHSAQLIREGNFAELDLENLAEEIESMGKRDKRTLINRFAILLAHLLKWQYQPQKRSNSWQYTIEEQRDKVLELLEDSPSLNYELEQKLENAYKKAVRIAAIETGLSKSNLPGTCPFSPTEALTNDFLPDL